MSCNRLIAGLPRRVRNDLARNGQVVELQLGGLLHEPGAPFAHVWFPLTSCIATIPAVEAQGLEIRLVGNEGMLGANLALDVDAVPMRARVQGAGTALRIGADRLAPALRRSGTLRRRLRRYLGVLAGQQLQGRACNRSHRVEARLARHLLMAHDRAHADRFHLAQDFLAEMLNASRGDIGAAVATLRRQHAIRHAPGVFRVLDRAQLEAVSCECYRLGTALYDQALGAPVRRRPASARFGRPGEPRRVDAPEGSLSP